MNSKRCLAITVSLGHAAFAVAQPVPQTPALPVTADNYTAPRQTSILAKLSKRALWANSGMAASWRRSSTGA